MKTVLTLLAALTIESLALYLIFDNFLNYRLPLEFQVHFLQCMGLALLHWFYTVFLGAKENRENYKISLLERIAINLPNISMKARLKSNSKEP